MDEELDLRELFQVIVQRKAVIIGTLLLAVVTAFVVSKRLTPIFEASSTILIQKSQSSVESLFVQGLSGSSANDVSNYVEILRSRTMAELTSERLGAGYDVRSPEFSALRDSISVQPVGNTDLIRISAQNADPREAADIVNAMAESFIELSRRMNSEEATSARAFIQGQLALVEGDLYESELALQSYREREQVLAPTEQTRIVLERLTALESEKMESEMAKAQTEQRLAEVRRRIQAEDPTLITSRTISNNPLVSERRTELAALETEIAGIVGQYGEEHPRVKALRAQAAEVESQLSNEVERILTTETRTSNPIYQALSQELIELETESVLYGSRLEGLAAQITTVEAQLEQLPQKELELARLTRDQNVSEQIYMLLRTNYEEARITEAMQTANATVVDPALVPRTPIQPRTHLNVAIAAFLGLFVGVGLAFFLAFLDTSLKSADEVEALLGIPVMGRILVMDSDRE